MEVIISGWWDYGLLISFFTLSSSFLQRECIPFILYYEKAMRKEQKHVKNRLQHMLNDTREMQSPLSNSTGQTTQFFNKTLQEGKKKGYPQVKRNVKYAPANFLWISFRS